MIFLRVICVGENVELCDEVSFFSKNYEKRMEGAVLKLFRDGSNYLNKLNNFVVESPQDDNENYSEIVSLDDLKVVKKSGFMEYHGISNLNVFPKENYFVVNYDLKTIFGGFMVGLTYDYRNKCVNMDYLVNEVSQNTLRCVKEKGFSYFMNNNEVNFDDFTQRDAFMFHHISLYTANFIDELIYQDENFVKNVSSDPKFAVLSHHIELDFNR